MSEFTVEERLCALEDRVSQLQSSIELALELTDKLLYKSDPVTWEIADMKTKYYGGTE